LEHLFSFKKYSIIDESLNVERIDPSDYITETVGFLPFNDSIKQDKDEFLKKIIWIAKDIKANPYWLMILIKHCSNFQYSSFNQIGSRVGLINWTPNAVPNYIDPLLGNPITSADVQNMPSIEQLDMVRSFYKKWMLILNIKEFETPGDFFALTFFPDLITVQSDWMFPIDIVKANKNLFSRFTNVGDNSKNGYYEYCNLLIENVLMDEYQIPKDHCGMLGASVCATDPGSGGDKFDQEILELARIVINPSIEKQMVENGI